MPQWNWQPNLTVFTLICTIVIVMDLSEPATSSTTISHQGQVHMHTYNGRRYTKLSLEHSGEFLCYALNADFSGCHDDTDMVCPEHCGRVRRSKRSDWAPTSALIEAIYFRDMRVQGLSFSDPESWKDRRRKRWRRGTKSGNSPSPSDKLRERR